MREVIMGYPSRREPLGYSGQLFRYAKGPISEDDFPRPGEDVTEGDWGCFLKSYRLQG